MMDEMEKQTPDTAAPPWPEGAPVTLPQGAGGSLDWRSSPARTLLRCVAAALYRDGTLKARALARAFKELVPEHAHVLGVAEVSDRAVAARGYNAWFYPAENPERNDKVRPYYELAKEIVARGRVIDVDEVLRHAQPQGG